MKENICLESGCPGLCCCDTDIQVTKFERRRLWPDAIKQNSLKELRRGPLIEGYAFYARLRLRELGPEAEEVGWKGKCPNLLPDGSCKFYEEREYAARNFKIGSKECNQVRCENGLPPIFFEPVE